MRELETRLGHRFKDPDLLRRALTHASVSTTDSNERLEFLGDRVLGLVIAEKLHQLYPGDPEGILALTSYQDWQVYLGHKLEKGPSGSGGGDHFANFVKAVRARDPKLLNADIAEGHLSSAYCHLGNIAYRLGRKLHINPSTESFVNDSEADAMLTREYRKGFEVPAKS